MIGDIVLYHDFTWVVDRQDFTSIPSGTWILLRDDKDGLRISLSAFGGWSLIKTPSFPVDMAVKYETESAVILEDKGETVRIGFDREMVISELTLNFDKCATDVRKGNLVLQNLHKFRDAE